MASASEAARLDPVNMKAGASFYFLKPGGPEGGHGGDDELFWNDDDGDSDEDEMHPKDGSSERSSLRSQSSLRLTATRVKSALSFFSVNSTPARPISVDDIFNDEISATFVSISDDEGSDDDEEEDLQSKATSDPTHGSSTVGGTGAISNTNPSSADSSYKPSPNGFSASKSLASTPSFVKSMNQYLVRRLIAEEQVSQGRVQAEHGSGGGVKSVHEQGDLEMYSEEKQYARSKIKRSPVFRGEAKRLWELVAPGEPGSLTRGNYVKLITKCSRLIVPPPWNKEDLLQTAMDDWDKDLQWAHEHDLVPKDAKELNYEAFFKSIYELVDMWTETAEEDEYVSMIRRLIQGVTSADSTGVLRWKNDADIKFDTFFSFTGKDETSPTTQALAEVQEEGDEDEDDDEGEEEGEMEPGKVRYEGEFDAAGEDHRPSVLEGMTKKSKKRKNKSVKAPLSPAKVMAKIAAIFQAKQQADLWASTSSKAKPIRLDRFVLRSFMQEFGTRGIARRHLRHFVTSAQKHLLSPGGPENYPRIHLFCILTGIVTLPPANEFNPRISAEYFQPALRFLFPNPRSIEEILGDGSGKGAMLMRQAVERATMPMGLAQMLGGPFAIQEFRSNLKELTQGNGKKGQGMVNFDRAMVLALKLWLFSDSLRGVREKYALMVLQRFFRRARGGFALIYENVENHVAVGPDGSAVPMARQCICEVAFAPNSALCRKCGRKRAPESGWVPSSPMGPGHVTSSTAEVPPSPRVAEKLSEARDLDSRLNAPVKTSVPLGASSLSPTADTSGLTQNQEKQAWPKPLAPPVPRAPPTSSAHAHCDPEVAALLKSLGLAKYMKHFADEEVDMASLRLMSEFDLAELKLSKGARVKLKAKLSAL